MSDIPEWSHYYDRDTLYWHNDTNTTLALNLKWGQPAIGVQERVFEFCHITTMSTMAKLSYTLLLRGSNAMQCN